MYICIYMYIYVYVYMYICIYVYRLEEGGVKRERTNYAFFNTTTMKWSMNSPT